MRDIISAQTLLKKDQIVTKKRLSDTVSDKQLEISLMSFRAHVQEQLTKFNREILQMRAIINNQKFEITTSVLKQIKSNNQVSQVFQQNIQQEQDNNSNNIIQDGQNYNANLSHFITKSSFAQGKAEIYDYLSQKIQELNQIYSSKIEMMSNFMIQAQDEIRDLKSVKNDFNLKFEDVKTTIEQKYKFFKDQIQDSAHQIVHISSLLKDQSGYFLHLKNQISDIQIQLQNEQYSSKQNIIIAEQKYEIFQNEILENLNQYKQEKQMISQQQHFSSQQLPMSEVVKQISMLATSLHNFEKENIVKIEKNQQQVEYLDNLSQKLVIELQQIKQDVKKGLARQEEAEQNFLKSFQEIKTIVLSKLIIYDKQIEKKEENEKIKQDFVSMEIIVKSLKEQIHQLVFKITLIDKEKIENNFRNIDAQFIELNDTFSKMYNQTNLQANQQINLIQNNQDIRIQSLANQIQKMIANKYQEQIELMKPLDPFFDIKQVINKQIKYKYFQTYLYREQLKSKQQTYVKSRNKSISPKKQKSNSKISPENKKISDNISFEIEKLNDKIKIQQNDKIDEIKNNLNNQVYKQSNQYNLTNNNINNNQKIKDQDELKKAFIKNNSDKTSNQKSQSVESSIQAVFTDDASLNLVVNQKNKLYNHNTQSFIDSSFNISIDNKIIKFKPQQYQQIDIENIQKKNIEKNMKQKKNENQSSNQNSEEDEVDDENITNPFILNKKDKKAQITLSSSPQKEQNQIKNLNKDKQIQIKKEQKIIQKKVQQPRSSAQIKQEQINKQQQKYEETLCAPTQNILVLDDKRDESKPSIPSSSNQISNQFMMSQDGINVIQQDSSRTNVQNGSRGDNNDDKSGSNQQSSNQKPIVLKTMNELKKIKNNKQSNDEIINNECKGKKNVQLVQLNSSGESIQSTKILDDNQITNLIISNYQLKKAEENENMNCKADEITFQLLADLVAKDIALMLKSIIIRE